MRPDEEILESIRQAALGTPEPARAERNLKRFREAVQDAGEFRASLLPAARLFSASQFLANFCVANPDELQTALAGLERPVEREWVLQRAGDEFALFEDMDIREFMKRLRLFKKRYLLRITMRDLMGRSDIQGTMEELTSLAEAVLETALGYCLMVNRKRFGEPSEMGKGLSLIALGKLGGEEINYSSDVDLVAVYGEGGGETSGVTGPTGVLMGRLTDHEFFCKVVEMLNRVLSTATDDGIAYRVDLRLRPQGQKGEITMPLGSYRAYYESWGRTWERMTFIRARPVAGDPELGRRFMEMVEHFVWRKTVDYADIEEIKALKKKIDSTFLKDDIKRGYGGIREAEFFVQTFQLIYGAEHRPLRTYRLLHAIQGLRRMRLIPEHELASLWESYLHFRRLEHFLQMKDDLQTYNLPSSRQEKDALARLMGFPSGKEFLSDLRLRRMKVKNMYNSLLGTEEDINAEAMSLIEGDMGDAELAGYLSFRGVADTEAGLRNLKKIREHAGLPKTQHERALMRRVIPDLLNSSLRAESPDRALAGLERFFAFHGITEAYLAALTEKKALSEGIVRMFSLSTFLTRLFLSSRRYLNVLVEEMPIRKSLARIEEELERTVRDAEDLELMLTAYRAVEWLRLGMLFLSGIFSAYNLQRYLSHLADAMVRAAVLHAGGGKGFSVVALGKHGGRELTYGSDLDLLFIASDEKGLRAAEKVIKVLTSYTARGKLYDVDMRLRPDGTKGALVKDLEGYRKYYLHHAQGWEVQALLKARPVGGDRALGLAFKEMARGVITERGPGVRREDIARMRERIVGELAHEQQGMDIKLGPGGMEEIEFYVQWLQLKNAGSVPRILVQDTLAAMYRMVGHKVLGAGEGRTLINAYRYYERVKTFLRLNEEHAVGPDSATSALAAKFMGHGSTEEFMEHLKGLREEVLKVVKG